MWEVPKLSKTGTKFSKTGSRFSTKLSKTGSRFSTKLSKTGTKLSEIQSNGRVIPLRLYKPVWDPELPVCSSTPRFSYEGAKTAVRDVCAVPVLGTSVVRGYGYGPGYGTPGGYTGWVIGGLYRYPTQPLREVPETAKRAP